MTTRRASALAFLWRPGVHVRRMAAGLCKAGGPAARLAGGLLLAASPLHAAVHAHHGTVQSAGKAQAHVLHETAARATRSPGKPSSRNARHPEESGRSLGKPRNKGTLQKHTKERDEPKHAARAHAGRKRHEAVPVDDPQPIHRARNTGAEREPRSQIASRGTSLPPYVAPVPAERSTALSSRNGLPGNVARNLARRAVHGQAKTHAGGDAQDISPAAALTSGVSHPDDFNDAYPTATVTAATPQTTQPVAEAVEGIGGEVDFNNSHAAALRTAPIAPPQGTAAEQARDLREAAEAAAQPMFVPLYNRDGRIVAPPPLKGSREILVHQNQMADDAGLSRIQDDADLNRLRRAHLLVDLPETASLRVNEGLPGNRRAARPWAVRFAEDIADAFYARFGEPLQVNSAVRTVAYQLRLQRVNGNAASIHGEGASPHLTGQALDFGKRGMSVAQLAWMRNYLMPLIDAGKIDVEEEFQQACFHISVYASYVPVRRRTPARTEVAQTTHAHAASAPVVEDDLH